MSVIVIEGEGGLLATIKSTDSGLSVSIINSKNPDYLREVTNFKDSQMAKRWATKLLRQAHEDNVESNLDSTKALDQSVITVAPAGNSNEDAVSDFSDSSSVQLDKYPLNTTAEMRGEGIATI